MAQAPAYLQPYLSAAAKYGGGFGALLWASPRTQAARFEALLGEVDIRGLTVMDVGCGRADLLEHMMRTKRFPRAYIGLEAVDALATVAEEKRLPNCRIIRGDFLSDPALLSARADVLLISGSLNTMDDGCFYSALHLLINAAGRAVVFNFLSSPDLAGLPHLYWRLPGDVLSFCRKISPCVEFRNDYLPGDATISVWKEPL